MLILIAALSAALAFAAPLPYDESADAKAAVQKVLAAGQAERVPVLVVFGANWCEDCRALDVALHEGRNAELMAREFRVVKVDVGNFNRNLDVVALYCATSRSPIRTCTRSTTRSRKSSFASRPRTS